MTDHLAKF